MSPGTHRFLRLLALFAGILFALRYILPLVFPFLLGAALAFSGEPMVRFFCVKCRFPRSVASGLGVTMAFSLLALGVMLLLGLLFREARALTGLLPDATDTLRSAMDTLSARMLTLARRAPESLRPFLIRNVTELFTGGSALLDRIGDFLLRLASGIISRVPRGALSLVTGIISSFMISAKLPVIQAGLRKRIPPEKLANLRMSVARLKAAVTGWLKAQLKLSGVTFMLTGAGFWLLGIPHFLLWGVLVALVDAFPILGTGTVLVPWSIFTFAQGDPFRAFALLGLYAAAALIRSALEPRLVGRCLGLDPLVTLMALYAGFRLFGLPGMLLSPLLAVTAAQLVKSPQPEADT